jgi:hypothetical protein
VADNEGNPIRIDYNQLKTNAKGADPFKVPGTADPNTDPNLIKLFNARFMTAFQATIGLPSRVDPTKFNIVELGVGAASVTYNMVCSDFVIVNLDPGSRFSPQRKWFVASQNPADPWLFSSKVDLRLSTVTPNKYNTLSANMQQSIQNIFGAPFSVQQLLYDLSNTALESVPTINGVAPGTKTYELLEDYFRDVYFTQLQKNGQPVLSAQVVMGSVPDQSSLKLTG